MDVNNIQYISLLVVSVALTFVVGRLLVTAGQPFLQEVFQDEPVTRSVNLLLSVLFHLITLGVLAIISGIDLGPAAPLERFVTRLGVVLLVLGVAYGISMLVLIRIRERRRATTISEHVQERLAERGVDARPHHETHHEPAGYEPAYERDFDTAEPYGRDGRPSDSYRRDGYGQQPYGQQPSGQDTSGQGAPGQGAPGQGAPGQGAPGQGAPQAYPPAPEQSPLAQPYTQEPHTPEPRGQEPERPVTPRGT